MVAFCLLAAGGGFAAGASEIGERYQKILAEANLGEKEKIARELAGIGGEESLALLTRLLEDDHYWNRLAAIEGLRQWPAWPPGVREKMVRRLAVDPMVATEMKTLVLTHPAVFFDDMIRILPELTREKDRESFLLVLGEIKTPAARDALRARVLDETEPCRGAALRALIQGHPPELSLARAHMSHREMGLVASALVLEYGGPEDLNLFVSLLPQSHLGDGQRVVVYQAVAKWAPPPAMEKICLAALTEDREVALQGALIAFAPPKVPGAFDPWCRLVTTGKSQRTRFLAAANLVAANRREALPFLIPLLRESYQGEGSPVGISVVSSILTFGITGVFETLHAASSRSDFESRRRAVVAALSRWAKANPGSDHRAWHEWAVLHGYSVEGDNLAAWLFSSDKVRRNQAVSGARLLLGPPQVGLRPDMAPDDEDLEIRLELARRLWKWRPPGL